jgi:hypothetical protein
MNAEGVVICYGPWVTPEGEAIRKFKVQSSRFKVQGLKLKAES